MEEHHRRFPPTPTGNGAFVHIRLVISREHLVPLSQEQANVLRRHPALMAPTHRLGAYIDRVMTEARAEIWGAESAPVPAVGVRIVPASGGPEAAAVLLPSPPVVEPSSLPPPPPRGHNRPVTAAAAASVLLPPVGASTSSISVRPSAIRVTNLQQRRPTPMALAPVPLAPVALPGTAPAAAGTAGLLANRPPLSRFFDPNMDIDQIERELDSGDVTPVTDEEDVSP